MVKGGFTAVTALAVLIAGFLLVNPVEFVERTERPGLPPEEMIAEAGPISPQLIRAPAAANAMSGATLPPPVKDVLRSGVLIVISKGSQQMFVFRDGALWDTSPVSTGKPGKDTPSGVFPILQKRVHHRSNIYANAPMPHMQRMTWGGIALHAGELPGYPASHGCIRLPADFARALYKITGKGTTTVVVVDQALQTDGQARLMALHMPLPSPGERGHLIQRPEPRLASLTDLPVDLLPSTPRIARAEPVRQPARSRPTGREQTIQLAAPGSIAEAEAYWSRVSNRYPEIAGFDKTIIPARVHSRQVYRLRVTGPGAHASCTMLKRSGTDCFPVT